MANESGPDSRPISVSELLARSQEDADTATPKRERGRRRVGRDGAVSVSELTGEIPRVTTPTEGSGDQSAASTPATGRPNPQAPNQSSPVTPTGRTPAAPQSEPSVTRQSPAAEASPSVTPTGSAPSAPTGSAPAAQAPAGPAPSVSPAAPSPQTGSFVADDRRAGPGGPRPDAFPPADAFGRPDAFPRSDNPIPRRYADDLPVADRAPVDRRGPGPVPSAPPTPQAGPVGAQTASGMPSFLPGAPLSTRDFSSDAVARRLVGGDSRDTADRPGPAADNSVTGIIPVVGDDDVVVVEPDDVDGVDLESFGGPPSSDLDDFDAYRAFADIEEDEPTTGRRKRFGWLRKKGSAESTEDLPAVDGPDDRRAPQRPDPVEETTIIGGPLVPDTQTADDRAWAAPGPRNPGPFAAAPASARDVDDVDPTEYAAVEYSDAEHADSGYADGRFGAPGADPAGTDTVFGQDDFGDGDVRPNDPDGETTGVVPPVGAGTAALAMGAGSGRRAARRAAEDLAGHEPAGDARDSDHFVDAGRPDFDDTRSADAPITDSTTPDTTTTDTTTSDTTTPDTTTTDSTAAGHGPDAVADRASKYSPLVQWLIIAGQAIIGLAVGLGLFWGFTELWKWNVYFALVLAVLVIFGVVTFAHVVRRTRDLTTTLLALGVGLIVTIGPLVILAT
ncbi:hypothetical protein [Gordonia soli]|uniref:Uncharacterized protein n=1 Tax=Gordonia soli NBRC 108243 TaxID=1223545 RepID=M0QHU7_9ACTN|nr:hypothetical protein [Gordonia soli]GAC68019.1 hypothetical protein GS4_11_02910 [Gordonia soli NBRC 108243]